MEIQRVKVNKSKIFDRCNVELTLHRSITGIGAEPEIIMHSHGSTWFDSTFNEVIDSVVNELSRLSKGIEPKIEIEGDDVTFLIIANSAEQLRRLPTAIDKYITEAIVEAWGAGKVEGIVYGKSDLALSELKHVTLLRDRTYRRPNF